MQAQKAIGTGNSSYLNKAKEWAVELAASSPFFFLEERRKIKTNQGLGALRKSFANALFFFFSSREINTILPTLPVTTLNPLVNLERL